MSSYVDESLSINTPRICGLKGEMLKSCLFVRGTTVELFRTVKSDNVIYINELLSNAVLDTRGVLLAVIF
jgi:hypothetical protein